MKAALACWLALLGPALAQDAPQEVPEVQVAALRVVHLSPDAPQFDALIDGQLTLRDLSFTTVSRYVLVPAGRRDVRLFPHQGQARGENGEENPLQPLEPITITADLDAGGYYTVVASGFYNPPASGASSGSLTVQLEEGVSAQVRGPRNYLVTLTQSTPLTGLDPGSYTVTASREGYRTAEYEVEVTAGSAVTLPISLQEGEGESQPVTSAPGLEVSERPWSKTQLQLYQDDYSSFPAAGQAFVRFVHAAPASPALTVYGLASAQGDTPQVLIENLGFPNASPYLVVPVTLDGLQITVAGTDLLLSTFEGLSFASGALYTIYLSGSETSGTLTPIPYLDTALRGTLP